MFANVLPFLGHPKCLSKDGESGKVHSVVRNSAVCGCLDAELMFATYPSSLLFLY